MLEVGKRFAIKGTWDKTSTPPGKLEILLNPSYVFGTGYHASTRALLELLEDSSGESILDVGCGSGIVAIASFKLGTGRIVALDVSEEALDATRANITSNNADVVVVKGTVEQLEERFDVVACNIPDPGFFSNSLGSLAERLTPKGHLLMIAPTDQVVVIEAMALMSSLTRIRGNSFDNESTALVFEGR